MVDEKNPLHLVKTANLEPNGNQHAIQEQEQVQKQESEHPQQYPVSTHVQYVGNRPFELSLRTINNLQLLILTFPRGLFLLMAANNANCPTVNGESELNVHRKFIPAFKKYLHWITFTFTTTGTKVHAQIMMANRLEAAGNLTQGGGSACFLESPFKQQRRSQPRRRRIMTSFR